MTRNMYIQHTQNVLSIDGYTPPDSFVMLTKYCISCVLVALLGISVLQCSVDGTKVTWHEMGGACYGLSNVKETYNESKTICADLDSEIVQVVAYSIHEFLGTLMIDSEDYWVGLQLKGSNYTWSDGSLPRSDMWVSSEPNFSGNKVRYTRKLRYSSNFINSSTHLLADNPENETYRFICMKSIECPKSEIRGKRVSSEHLMFYKEIDTSWRRSSVHCATHCTSMNNCNMIGYNKTTTSCTTYKWTSSEDASAVSDGYQYYTITRPCT